MIVYRRKHFSQKKKEKKDSSDKIGAGLVAGGIVGNTAGLLYASKGHKALDNDKIAEKLKKEAKERGYKVKDNISPIYSHIAPTDKVAKEMNKLNGGKFFDTKYIATGKDRVDIFAHELGHSRHYDHGVGSKLGKLAHKAYTPSKFLTAHPAGYAASLANGIHSGYVSKKKENQGEKESKWNRHKSWALPLAAATPMVAAEFAASRQGLKALKAAGASKEAMKMAKKKLLAAGGTYLAAAGINAGIGELGRAVGRQMGPANRKKKEKD